MIDPNDWPSEPMDPTAFPEVVAVYLVSALFALALFAFVGVVFGAS